MLEELTLENLGVIGRAHVELGPGLTVITGETGAGKTMFLTGLALLMGRKADAAVVRSGADAAVVQGRLVATEAVRTRVEESGGLMDEDGTVLLGRTLAASGRSRAHAGGRSVPQGVLAEIAEERITVHGQSDQLRLKSPAHQREALDDYADAVRAGAHRALLEEYRAVWTERNAVAEQLASVDDRREEMTREAERLREDLGRIEELDPRTGEDEDLLAEIGRLGNAEDLRLGAEAAHRALSGDDTAEAGATAVGLVELARRGLADAGRHDPAAAALAERLAEVVYALTDISTEVASYREDVQADPVRLEAAQQRLAAVTALTRRHGRPLGEVLEWAREAQLRLLELDTSDDAVSALRERLDRLEERVRELGERLTASRVEAGRALSASVTAELDALSMAGAGIQVRIAPADAPGPWGLDAVELLFVPHGGAVARPLGKGASGGELSRVMLALELVLATARPQAKEAPSSTPSARRGAEQAETSGDDPLPAFVFDEVDAGVGGRAAVEIGRRLAALGRTTQVLVVTHLAQVAAFADRHVVVSKSTSVGDAVVTESDVRVVQDADRVRELARMLSGQEDLEVAREHAAELLRAASVG